MKKYLPLLAALALVGAGCSSTPAVAPTPTPTPAATAPAPTPVTAPEAVAVNQVMIQDFAFSPAAIKIKKGTTVTWTNKDSAKHTVTAESGKWTSDLLATGASYTHTFADVGTFKYKCTVHPYMTGTVEVTE